MSEEYADMRSQRSAASKIDWATLGSTLGLRGQTAASLSAFKKRNDDARRKVNQLSNLPQEVDFAHYRNTLKNTAIIDEIEQHFKRFKPATYDVSRQLKAIEAFEAQAVRSAEETKSKVDAELATLDKALKNIETARPFDQLLVVRPGLPPLDKELLANALTMQREVVAAKPELDQITEKLVANGRWAIPGYKVRGRYESDCHAETKS